VQHLTQALAMAQADENRRLIACIHNDLGSPISRNSMTRMRWPPSPPARKRRKQPVIALWLCGPTSMQPHGVEAEATGQRA